MALSNRAPATLASLAYITIGSVLIVWTVVWFIYYQSNPPSTRNMYYLVFGSMATGGVLLLIGLRLGSIGRSAKQAETPPAAVVQPPVQVPAAGAPAVTTASPVAAVTPQQVPMVASPNLVTPPSGASAPVVPTRVQGS